MRTIMKYGLALMLMLIATKSNAVTYVEFYVSGDDVVMTTNGSIDLGDLQKNLTSSGKTMSQSLVASALPFIATSPSAKYDVYVSFAGTYTGPANFGTSTSYAFGNGSGDVFGFAIASGSLNVYLPYGYSSERALSASTTFANKTLEDLGLTANTNFTWSWGAGEDADSIQLSVVPEPATMAILGLGGLFFRRKK